MKPIQANVSNFETVVLQADEPVLVDFWAEWCPPCRVLGPMLDDAAKQLGSSVRIVKVNADESMQLMQRYGITSIPTLILFHNGEEVDRRSGVDGLKPLSDRALALAA